MAIPSKSNISSSTFAKPGVAADLNKRVFKNTDKSIGITRSSVSKKGRDVKKYSTGLKI